MIAIQKKSAQQNATVFGGNFITNRPVAAGTKANVAPYSNLFYLSHGVTVDECEFGLHPHEGFEIMTFVLEGRISHFDTESNKWTALEPVDFQVMQSNSGIRHRERMAKATSGFQIWFDPDFSKSLNQKPTYTDCRKTDFTAAAENGILTTTYVGGTSAAVVTTPKLTIKKLHFDSQTKTSLTLDPASSYTFYVLRGGGTADNQPIEKDDAIRILQADRIALDFTGDLFCIQTPAEPGYKAVWE